MSSPSNRGAVRAVSAPLAALTALTVLLVSSSPSASSPAPTNPSFVQAWGTAGNAGGQFNAPSAVATDAVGNVYVVDTGNHRIEKFDNQGHFLLRWGSLGAGGGQFSSPSGVAVDRDNNVLVVDQGNNRIQEFSSDGLLTHTWGTPGTGSGEFTNPTGIAVDAAGDFYVTDAGDRVQKFAPDGSFLLQWGTTGAGAGEFSSPAGIAVDPKGNVDVVDAGNQRIQKFGSTGTYLTQWGSPGSGAGELNQPFGIGIDAVGNVYVAELGNDRIQKFTSDGTPITAWGTPGAGSGTFDLPAGVALDPEGNVFVAEINNARIQKFSGAGASLQLPTPAFSANIGAFGSGNGQLNTPYGVATDANGWLYVADTFNSRVQRFSGNGVFYQKFGSAGSLPGQLGLVYGIAVDASGNVYVTSSDNRVAKFNAAGVFLLQWGSNGTTAGKFNAPFGIAADASGSVYVADSGNNRIQKFSNTGVFLAQWGSAGSGPGQFISPLGVAADRAGNIYVSDEASRVQKFTSGGAFVAQWGIANLPLYSASSIAVDALGDVYVSSSSPGSNIQKFSSEGTSLAQWGSYGSGNGQFAPAYGLTVDGTGNVYVADYGGNRVVKFITPPAITLVSDVGNDQGRQARLRIKGASVDAPVNGGVTGYAVYRRVDAPPASASAASPNAIELAGWDYLGTQPAAGDPEYSMVVPTLADANATSATYTAFLVRALTSDPITHYDSFAEYGYSIDNLSPPAPTPAAAAYVAAAMHLHWGVSSASDFAVYRVYKGASADFAPAPGNLLAATTDTGYVDVAPPGSWYKLSAVDLNGNESAYAVLAPSPTASVGDQPRAAFVLDGVRPNPTSGRTLAVAFALPSAEPAQLEVSDVMGRLVTRRDVGAMGAGPHVVDLASGRTLAPGLYLVRLSQGTQARVARVVVIR
jgi:tripartite motif-containing protein 71